MRELADYNVSRYAEIAAWPLREALLTLLERQKRAMRAQYERDIDRFWGGNIMKDRPEIPESLTPDV